MLALAAAMLLSSTPPDSPRQWAWVPLVVSGAAGIGGVTLLVVSGRQDAEADTFSGAEAERQRFIATSNRTGGVLILLFAACSAGLSAILLGADSHLTAAVAPTTGGMAFALGWRL